MPGLYVRFLILCRGAPFEIFSVSNMRSELTSYSGESGNGHLASV